MYTIRSMHAYDLTLTTTGREIEPPIHTVVTSGTSHSRMASSTGPPNARQVMLFMVPTGSQSHSEVHKNAF